jgi:hypothetical protein
MRMPMNGTGRFVVALAACIAATASLTCANNEAFQPLTYGAKPWTPPAKWDPEPNSGGGQPGCPVGYYIAIRTCDGCSKISYALCDGAAFTQCVCGGPFWQYPSGPGATCPQNLSCDPDDFPPTNWLEFVDYTGPGWAGLQTSGTGN